MEQTLIRMAEADPSGLGEAPAPKPEVPAADVPRAVGEAAELVIAARGDATRMARTHDHSAIPMLVLDGERRFVDVNRPARLLFRRSLAEMKALRVDDLTSPPNWPDMEEKWSLLMAQGTLAAPYEVGFPDGPDLAVLFWGLRDALPGRHLIVFAPAGWTDDELSPPVRDDTAPKLSPRELEVLRLAAEGLSGPRIAELLSISPATIKTHFTHIYAKLGVTDRAAAVARALRLGLID